MPSASCVLILGARGRFGLAATRAFAQAGWKVYAQVRPGASGPAIAGVQWLQAQPGDTAALAAAANGADVVVQGLSPLYTHKAWAADMPGLTQAAIDISRKLGATLLLPASVYNFGAAMPPVLHEDTPQRPTTFKGRMRVASEQQIREATQDGRMKAVVIRGGDFFGSGTGSWLDLVMAKQLRQGKFTYPGALDVPTTWAYLPDMARSFVKVAEQRHRLPAFETLHFGGYQLTGQDWVDAVAPIAREQGWVKSDAALRVTSVSWTLMRALGLFIPTVAALCEMRYLWRTPYALANARLVALIGEEPRTPFPQALRKALDELGMLAPNSAAAGWVSLSPR
ncbi:NAD-dependent epimerase/dehydratase family protein [Caenimonas soli]|uniref:NAD-dependent epimerase/dehydratase family protein n=1 Tax=Caenimonas soli TaxID=2735555 RepID=UPI0015525949|nr:NAD-dependent epimerase/dehydratase family protein [Caenimonas soli]NPC59183.1 NAD-dependent epimerase/dehydratase family protein [Caenimonas soli]